MSAETWRTLSPKPVVFRGAKMRSRLERHAARLLTSRGIPWRYEPQRFNAADGRSYLPDFQLWPRSRASIFVEVKPCAVKCSDESLDDAFDKLLLIRQRIRHAVLVLWIPDGESLAHCHPDSFDWYWAHGNSACSHYFTALAFDAVAS